MRFSWQEPDCSAELEFYETFHEPTNWPDAGSAEEVLNPGGHLEVSGRLRGSVRIGETTHAINALAHRDRSWGNRESATKLDWRRYRMVSGTVGPELSFHSFTLDRDEVRIVTGSVIRHGVQEAIKDLRCLTTYDADGYTVMGGYVIMRLEGGDQIRLKLTAVQGFMSKAMGQSFLTDTICRVEWDDKIGFCDLELSPNPLRGSYIPTDNDGSLLCIGKSLTNASDYSV
jgi:hypothetical protein